MTKIIAFGGRKQSGKTTSGEFVQTLFKHSSLKPVCQTYSFADPLKRDVCINILGLTEQQCYGSDEDKNTDTKLRWVDMPGFGKDDYPWPLDVGVCQKNEYMTAREVMEFVGTGIFRKIYQEVWVDSTLNKIKRDNPDIAIVLDVRFCNEVVAVKDNNGCVLKLSRNLFNSEAKSECGLDPENCDQTLFDRIIDNVDSDILGRNFQIIGFLRKQFAEHFTTIPLSLMVHAP